MPLIALSTGDTVVPVITAFAGEGVGVGVFVLVIGEGVPLPSAVALTLRLTPTLPQICCAKAMTSAGGRESFTVSRSLLLEELHTASLALRSSRMYLKKKGCKGKWGLGGCTLCKSACEHCFSDSARAALIKELSLQRHAKSLDLQPVEPIAERAELC